MTMDKNNQENLFSVENIDILIALSKSYGNDFDFGKHIRTQFRNSSLAKTLHNDETLGKEIRKILPKFQK